MGLFTSLALGLASMLEPMFTGSVLLGQAMSSLIVLAVRAVCLLIFDKNHPHSLFYGTILYFAVSTLILIAAMASTPVSIVVLIVQYFLKSEYVTFFIKKRRMET